LRSRRRCSSSADRIPFIVLADADIEAATATAVRARNQNNGQSCIAAKRFIVVESIAADFERRFAKGVEDLVVGDPMDPKTQVGPLARRDLLETLERQVEGSVRAGARVLTGGERLTGKGYFFRPTVLCERHFRHAPRSGKKRSGPQPRSCACATPTRPCASRTTPPMA